MTRCKPNVLSSPRTLRAMRRGLRACSMRTAGQPRDCPPVHACPCRFVVRTCQNRMAAQPTCLFSAVHYGPDGLTHPRWSHVTRLMPSGTSRHANQILILLENISHGVSPLKEAASQSHGLSPSCHVKSPPASTTAAAKSGNATWQRRECKCCIRQATGPRYHMRQKGRNDIPRVADDQSIGCWMCGSAVCTPTESGLLPTRLNPHCCLDYIHGLL
jgi:hypothetical protein